MIKNDTTMVSASAQSSIMATVVRKHDILQVQFWYQLPGNCHQQGATLTATRETVCENRGGGIAAAGRGLYIPPGAPSGERSDCGQIIPRTSSGEAFCSLRLAESSAQADVKAGCL